MTEAIETNRLKIYAASRNQMEAFIEDRFISVKRRAGLFNL